MTERFPVPREYRERDRSPRRDTWCDRLPGRAELVAERRGLTPDGVPGYGFLSVVWPVRDRSATGPRPDRKDGACFKWKPVE